MDIKCFVGGNEYRLTDKYSIRQQVGQASSSSLDVEPKGNYIPQSWEAVELKHDGTTFFWGIVQSVDTPVYSSKYQREIYPLQVLSGEMIFNNRIISDVFVDMKTHEIVLQIFNDYLIEEGFTLGTIGTFERFYENYVVPRLSLREVLNELADGVQAVAVITADRKFHFISRNEFVSVTPPACMTKLQRSESGGGIRTVQYVSGAHEETSLQQRSYIWETNQMEMVMSYSVDRVEGITIEGIPAKVGIRGMDDDDPTCTFLYRHGEFVISVNPNATGPTVGQLVAVLYYGYYSVEIEEENAQLIDEIKTLSGTSGRIEAVEVDTSITSYQDGKNKAEALLNAYRDREETISLQCEDIDASTLLTIWDIDRPELKIAGQYVVVERTITDFYNRFRVQVKLKNKNFYSRYGTVLIKDDKSIMNLSVRTDSVVFKRTGLDEKLKLVDTFGVIEFEAELYPSDTYLFDGLGVYPCL